MLRGESSCNYAPTPRIEESRPKYARRSITSVTAAEGFSPAVPFVFRIPPRGQYSSLGRGSDTGG